MKGLRESRRATDAGPGSPAGLEHVLRRSVHLAIAAVPFAYYAADRFADARNSIVLAVCAAVLLLEVLRIRSGRLLPGQREHERRRISAFAWGTLAVALALLVAPAGPGPGFSAGAYAIPLILGLALMDPVMGECRRLTSSARIAAAAGLVVSVSVWTTSHLLLGTPIPACLILAPLAVAGELFPFRGIDDNATIVLYPLAAATCLQLLA